MIRYSPEFKQSLVEMHNQGRSYTELAAEYGPAADSGQIVHSPRSGRRKMGAS